MSSRVTASCRDAGSDILREGTVDVHLTADGDTAAGQTAVHIAGNETEHGLEGRPALGGQGDELAAALVALNPVEQCQLILCELRQYLRNLVAMSQLGSHILYHLVDTWIAGMLLE